VIPSPHLPPPPAWNLVSTVNPRGTFYIPTITQGKRRFSFTRSSIFIPVPLDLVDDLQRFGIGNHNLVTSFFTDEKPFAVEDTYLLCPAPILKEVGM
jgi:hypothetical protein